MSVPMIISWHRKAGVLILILLSLWFYIDQHGSTVDNSTPVNDLHSDAWRTQGASSGNPERNNPRTDRDAHQAGSDDNGHSGSQVAEPNRAASTPDKGTADNDTAPVTSPPPVVTGQFEKPALRANGTTLERHRQDTVSFVGQVDAINPQENVPLHRSDYDEFCSDIDAITALVIHLCFLDSTEQQIQSSDPSFDCKHEISLCRGLPRKIVDKSMPAFYDLIGHRLYINGYAGVDPELYDLVQYCHTVADSLRCRASYAPFTGSPTCGRDSLFLAGKAYCEGKFEDFHRILSALLRRSTRDVQCASSYYLAYISVLKGRPGLGVIYLRTAQSITNDARIKVIWAYHLQGVVDRIVYFGMAAPVYSQSTSLATN